MVLTPADLELLEGSLLPAMERHYLRLLAHGLRTFQAIAASTAHPERLPAHTEIDIWAAQQTPMADDPAFRETFVDQLIRLVDPLEEIAARSGQSPLALQLPQLVRWAQEQADTRLSRQGQPPG
ncbi:MAG: hypothetical protein VKK99_04855 [Cyanobacteriota bacterium]|nr:hypothetical protein [Cyanobacteriota bacterium]